MLDKAQVEKQLAQFSNQFSDDFLFALVDLRLPVEEQIPRIVPGHQAIGLIQDGHYHVELIGPNESSAKNRRKAQIDEVRKQYPDIKSPKSLAEQLAEAKAEAEAYKAEAEKLKAEGSKAKEVKKEK